MRRHDSSGRRRLRLFHIYVAFGFLLLSGSGWPRGAEQTPAGSSNAEREARERVMRELFDEAFVPLKKAAPTGEYEDLVGYLRLAHGICLEGYETTEDVDEFQLKACENKAKSFRIRPIESPVFALEPWKSEAVRVRYDFQRSAFVVSWTDELRGSSECGQPILSIWKPATTNLPSLTYRTLSHLIHMARDEAESWKRAQTGTADGDLVANVVLLVSVQPKSGWVTRYSTPTPDGERVSDCSQGSLARIHGLLVTVGNYRWSYPAEWDKGSSNRE